MFQHTLRVKCRCVKTDFILFATFLSTSSLANTKTLRISIRKLEGNFSLKRKTISHFSLSYFQTFFIHIIFFCYEWGQKYFRRFSYTIKIYRFLIQFNSIIYHKASSYIWYFLHGKYEHTHSMIYYTQKYNIYLKILLLKFLLFCLQLILLNYILNISRVLIYFSTLSCLFYVAKILFLLTRNSSDSIQKKL